MIITPDVNYADMYASNVMRKKEIPKVDHSCCRAL